MKFDKVSIGTPAPDPDGESLQVVNGNVLLNSTNETIERGLIVRRVDTNQFALGPKFTLGRIAPGGDGDPNFRIFYRDDSTAPERKVLEFDSKGIVASVKPGRGSHFEGFLQVPGQPGDVQPVFRLNSSPEMQLEFGQGGNVPTDVFIRRCGPRCVTFPGAAVAAATVTGDDFRIRAFVEATEEVQPLSAQEVLTEFERLKAVMIVSRTTPRNRRFGVVRDDGPLSIEHQRDTSAVELIALLTDIVRQQERRIDALERRLLKTDESK